MRFTTAFCSIPLAGLLLAGCVANSSDDFASAEKAMNRTYPEQGSTSGESASPQDESTAQSAQGSPGAQQASNTTAPMKPGETVKLQAVGKLPPSATTVAAVAPRPGSAIYRCGGRGSLQIDNRRSSVTLLDPDGQAMVLPASPPGQLSRYGQKPYALILDGSDALYVKPGKPPFTCSR